MLEPEAAGVASAVRDVWTPRPPVPPRGVRGGTPSPLPLPPPSPARCVLRCEPAAADFAANAVTPSAGCEAAVSVPAPAVALAGATSASSLTTCTPMAASNFDSAILAASASILPKFHDMAQLVGGQTCGFATTPQAGPSCRPRQHATRPPRGIHAKHKPGACVSATTDTGVVFVVGQIGRRVE